MRKIAFVTALTISLFSASHIASAQTSKHQEGELMLSKQTTDYFISKLPDKIECISILKKSNHDKRDYKTTQATMQKHIFRLANLNFKFTGDYNWSESDASTAIYNMSSGRSNMNIIVGFEPRRAKILVIAPSLPQPNTCQAGDTVVDF